ncbi:CAMK protein kinase [Spizellomyces punctatus DAOM BR117]|uniref:CAMK protein kinase n=1 Tax=Spizellomyces punctatus (strain DAOM BR117) TaxID=645134 RepID=A0A0L0H729_SPIPD|nr:CAMK protein kinase [Spizellomyces punctatus DAOM BR117]KNC96528.1 CAMK protein kinase [Spizellomyces punctatus DAOM BR117]|eukprot:XP_016604568.1 CAMK protein kinase [Spizellomyces punctatus DAOM BR117]
MHMRYDPLLDYTQPLTDHDVEEPRTPSKRLNMDKPWGRLVCLNGRTKVIDLVKDSYIIGRSKDADIVVDDCPSCSKKHCRIRLVEDMPCLQDTSFNGTLVNGRRIVKQKASLTNRAEIEIKWDQYFVFYNLLDDPSFEDTNRQIINNRYYIFETQTLGAGSFATVYLAIDLDTCERLACKIIDKRKAKSSKGNREEHKHSSDSVIEQEISILKSVKHPNIVQVKDVVHTEEFVCIFLTRVTGGELFDYILHTDGVQEHEAKFIFYQILLAVKYLHGMNITHRDLKPENLLLESPKPFSRLIITDFGMAKMLGTSLERMRTKCGTFSYLAPEVLDSNVKGGYSKRVDCWSLGVLLYTLLGGYLPFGTDDNPTELSKRIREAEFDFGGPEWRHVSNDAKDLICRLLEIDPERRLTVEQALQHPWIASQEDLLCRLYARMLRKSEAAAARFRSNGEDLPFGTH